MRLLVKVVVACVCFVLLLPVIASLWFRYYTHDLPNIEELAKYAPATAAQVSGTCSGSSIAIPYHDFGERFVAALNTVETRLSRQISRTMFCGSQSKTLTREIAELRTANQIERRFSHEQILTIYVNRMYLGGNEPGVHSAAFALFHEDPDHLDIAQSALLAGMIRSPLFYSPIKHPDRALQRRNEIVDAMVANGSITSDEAQRAKSEPLGVITRE